MAATEKISITLGREELRNAKRLATELGLSLSHFINDSVRRRLEAQERKAAGMAVIAGFTPEDLPSEAEMRALLKHWKTPNLAPKQRPPKPRARARKARAKL